MAKKPEEASAAVKNTPSVFDSGVLNVALPKPHVMAGHDGFTNNPSGNILLLSLPV